MARRKTKLVTMTVTVRVPADLSAAEARREVRTQINHSSGYLSRLEEGDVKAVKVSAIKAPRSRALV